MPSMCLFYIICRFIIILKNASAIPTFFKLLKDCKARYLGIGKVDPNFKVFYEDKKNTKNA